MEIYPVPLPWAKGQTFLWELLIKILTALTAQQKTNTVVLELQPPNAVSGNRVLITDLKNTLNLL